MRRCFQGADMTKGQQASTSELASSKHANLVSMDFVDVTRDYLSCADPSLDAQSPFPNTAAAPTHPSVQDKQQQSSSSTINRPSDSSMSSSNSSSNGLQQTGIQQQPGVSQFSSVVSGATNSSRSSSSGGTAEHCGTTAAAAEVNSDEDCFDEEWASSSSSSEGDGSDAFSDVGDPAVTEVVYVREGVAVWPTKHVRIPGRLSLVMQHAVLFLAWLPYKAAAPAAAAASGSMAPAPAAAAAGACGKVTRSVAAAAVVAAAGGSCTDGLKGGVDEQRWLCADEDLKGVLNDFDSSSSNSSCSDGLDNHLQQQQQGLVIEVPIPLAVTRKQPQQQQQQQQTTVSAAAAAAAGKHQVQPAAAAAAAASSSASIAVDRSMYAIHPIPLSDIKAFVQHTPKIGQQHVTVVLSNGLTLPPLVFQQQSGVKEFIAVLQQHASLVKAASRSDTYLVNDTADPLQRCLLAMDVADIMLGAPPPGVSCVEAPAKYLDRKDLVAQGGWQDIGAAAAAAAAGGGGGFVDVQGSADNGITEGLCNAEGLCNVWSAVISHPAGRLRAAAAVAAAAAAAAGHPGLRFGLNRSGSPPSNAAAAAAAAAGSSDDTAAAADGCSNRLLDPHNRPWGSLSSFLSKQVGGMLSQTSGLGSSSSSSNLTHSVAHTLSKVGQFAVEGASTLVAAAVESWQADTLRYWEHEVQIPEKWREEVEQLGKVDDLGPEFDCPSPQRQQQQVAVDPVAAAVAAAMTESSIIPSHLQRSTSPAAAAAAAVGGDIDTDLGVFELLEGGEVYGPTDQIAAVRSRAAPPPLSVDELQLFLDDKGVMVNEAGFRERVFQGGIEPAARKEAWKFLLGVYPSGSSTVDRQQQQRQQQYAALAAAWEGIGPDQGRRFTRWRDLRSRIDKDVRRTDRQHPFYRGRAAAAHLTSLRDMLRTYSMFNPDLGYCQGMSDLASPLLVVMEGNEVDAFWCFVGLMERLSGNFSKDQAGMHAQLSALRRLVQVLDPQLHAFLEERDCLNYFFVFRWLLIHFKREFPFDQVLSLWEAFWSCPLTPHLHLYLAAAALIQHRRVLLSDETLDFDGLLRFCVQLSGRLDMSGTVRLAEALVVVAGQAGKDCLEGLP